MRLLSTVAMTIGAALLAGSPAQAQSRVIEPSRDWSVEQREEYCSLSRDFGEDDGKVVLYVYSHGPIGSYRITLEGESLPRNSNKAELGSAAFGGVEDMEDVHFIVSRRRDAGTINFLTNRADPGFRYGYAWSS